MNHEPPARLTHGDRIAVVSLSWGGPGAFPHRYAAGKQQLESVFGFEIIETPHALADPAWLARNPRARADDLMGAFSDSSINGIISSIGGDDSIRVLPFIDAETIRNNPKCFVGYSDTTVTHLACFKAGIASFYGPSVMSGFAENGGMHDYLVDSFRRTVMAAEPVGRLAANESGWTVEHLDWSDPANQKRKRRLAPSTPWRFHGHGTHRGHLIGGCLEVLEWLRGTPAWPTQRDWQGAILFLETSEEAPAPIEVTRALRAYAAEGVLPGLTGVLFARPGGGVDPKRFVDYEQAILGVVRDEEGLDLPIVVGMDFGHTDPMMTLPYGVLAEIDCQNETVSILESAVS